MSGKIFILNNKMRKIINAKLPPDARLYSLALDKLYRMILRREERGARIVAESIALLFPDSDGRALSSKMFDAYWKLGEKGRAIQIYRKAGRPFWLAEKVGRYYERLGLTAKAMEEYDLLIKEYMRMDILPLPRGPIQLFKVGKWCMRRDPRKAKKYLRLYLKAEQEDHGTGFGIRHKRQAEKLLKRLEEGARTS